MISDSPTGPATLSATRIKQHLQCQRQASVARQQGTHRRQRAARAVTTHRQKLRIKVQVSGMACEPLQGIPGIICRRGKLELRGQAVIDRHHGAARQVADLAAQHVVRGNAANRESAAMKIHKHRQFLSRWGVKARRYLMPAAHRNAEIIDPCYYRLGDFKHTRAGFVSSPGLLRRQRMKWRALGAGHAAEDAPHGRRQQAFWRSEMH